MVEKKIEFDKDGILLKVFEGSKEIFSFHRRRLYRYWTSARRKHIDGWAASFLGNYLMAHYSEGGGQGGCLALVDIDRNRIVHVSSGSFLTNVAILGDQYVFVVLNVAYYGHSSSWHVEWRNLHSKVDVCKGCNTIARIDMPDTIQFGGRFTQVQPALAFSEGFDVVLTGGGDQFKAVLPKEISKREA